MSGLPRVSGQECVKALGKLEFYLKRQHGSHMILRRDNPFAQVVVPDHNRVGPGNLTRHHQTGRPRCVRFCEVIMTRYITGTHY